MLRFEVWELQSWIEHVVLMMLLPLLIPRLQKLMLMVVNVIRVEVPMRSTLLDHYLLSRKKIQLVTPEENVMDLTLKRTSSRSMMMMMMRRMVGQTLPHACFVLSL